MIHLSLPLRRAPCWRARCRRSPRSSCAPSRVWSRPWSARSAWRARRPRSPSASTATCSASAAASRRPDARSAGCDSARVAACSPTSRTGLSARPSSSRLALGRLAPRTREPVLRLVFFGLVFDGGGAGWGIRGRVLIGFFIEKMIFF